MHQRSDRSDAPGPPDGTAASESAADLGGRRRSHEPADEGGGMHEAHRRERRARIGALIAGGVVVALIAYAMGWSRGSAADDPQGSSSVGGRSTSGAPQTTITTPVSAPTLPSVNLTVVSFEDGIPDEVDGHAVEQRGGWTTVDGAATPSEPAPLPELAEEPRLMGEGPDLLVDAGSAVSLASVKFATPTPLSGLVARYEDDSNYWAAVVDAKLSHVTLYEVKDGEQRAMGFIDAAVAPGTEIAITDVDGQVGLALDGRSKLISTFFGSEEGVSDDGIAGTKVGLLTGGGAPAFDQLAFG